MSLEKVEKDIQKILKRHGAYFKYKLTFPMYNILPEEVNLALKILEKHNMHIVVELKEKKSK